MFVSPKSEKREKPKLHTLSCYFLSVHLIRGCISDGISDGKRALAYHVRGTEIDATDLTFFNYAMHLYLIWFLCYRVWNFRDIIIIVAAYQRQSKILLKKWAILALKNNDVDDLNFIIQNNFAGNLLSFKLVDAFWIRTKPQTLRLNYDLIYGLRLTKQKVNRCKCVALI